MNYKHMRSVLVESYVVRGEKPETSKKFYRLHFTLTVPPEIYKALDEVKKQVGEVFWVSSWIL